MRWTSIAGDFADPATVVAGQSYALVITRPASNVVQVGERQGNDCPGMIFRSDNQTAPFSAFASEDMVFAVFVELPDTSPPDTTVTNGPKQKTKKRQATFDFSSSEPGSTFACSLDGGPFEPCTSPKTYDKLKRKKHTFAVVATDAAGNVDPNPALSDWKVKKKRR